MEQNIKEAIENIRPFLQRDGGDIELCGIHRAQNRKSKTAGSLSWLSWSSNDIKEWCLKEF